MLNDADDDNNDDGTNERSAAGSSKRVHEEDDDGEQPPPRKRRRKAPANPSGEGDEDSDDDADIPSSLDPEDAAHFALLSTALKLWLQRSLTTNDINLGQEYMEEYLGKLVEVC